MCTGNGVCASDAPKMHSALFVARMDKERPHSRHRDDVHSVFTMFLLGGSMIGAFVQKTEFVQLIHQKRILHSLLHE